MKSAKQGLGVVDVCVALHSGLVTRAPGVLEASLKMV